jgi:hypothetical protein
MNMNISSLIAMCRAQLVQLSSLRTSAERLGDVEQVADIDAKAAETQATLNQLLTLP